MPGEGIPSPSEVFLTGLTGEVNKEDVCQMVAAQQHMMMRFEKTNEMLLNFNMLSASRYEATQQEFKKHTHLLTEMKKDLDSIFGRIRMLKAKLSKQHPDAFKACTDVFDKLEEEEDETDLTPTQPTAPSPPGTSHPGATHPGATNPGADTPQATPRVSASANPITTTSPSDTTPKCTPPKEGSGNKMDSKTDNNKVP